MVFLFNLRRENVLALPEILNKPLIFFKENKVVGLAGINALTAYPNQGFILSKLINLWWTSNIYFFN